MKHHLLRYLLLTLMLSGCGTKLELPTAQNASEPVFGAGDTSYIRVGPDWDAANGYGFQNPWDIVVGADGYLFIADHGEARIQIISSAGSQVLTDAFGNDFSFLNPLLDPAGAPVFPMAIAQDTRLNLMIADSSNRLLVWNQYLVNAGVDSVADRIQFRSPTDDLLWIHAADSIDILLTAGWEPEAVHWSADNLETWLRPRLFWDASDSLEAVKISRYFVDPAAIRITGVSTFDDYCLVADAASNMILKLQYQPVALLLTKSGRQVYAYNGSMIERTVSAGTGNGTVNDPRGMIQDADGVLYYTQWGENFSVHQVGGSGFEYGRDDIMDIGRFNHASDIDLDATGNIYVADTGHNLIQQFNSAGKFSFNIGVSKVLVDSTISDSIMIDDAWQVVQRDTSYLVEVADILRQPRAVAVDASGIVYIADTGNDRIMRFQLSTELDYSTEN